MTGRLTMRRIVLPQATRIVIPAIGNEFIAMIKDSALVAYVGIQETYWRASTTGSRFFRSFETLLVAALIYWVLTIVFSRHPGADRAAPERERRADMNPVEESAASARSCRSRGLDAPDAVSIRDPFAKPGVMTPEGARPIVKVLGLEKFFGSNHVLRGCTMEVYPSETICLIGKSGLGQEHAPALHELPRGAHDGRDRGRTASGWTPTRSTRATARIASRSARSAWAPRWCSRSSTCSRTCG